MTRAASAAAPREEHEGKKKKSSFVTECFIFQKTGFRCASETLLLGIFFFHQAAYLSALVLDIILRAYLPSDQNFFPICFFIKIIRAWNQLLFFLLLTIFAIFIKSKQHISMSFLRFSAYLFAHLPPASSCSEDRKARNCRWKRINNPFED